MAWIDLNHRARRCFRFWNSTDAPWELSAVQAKLDPMLQRKPRNERWELRRPLRVRVLLSDNTLEAFAIDQSCDGIGLISAKRLFMPSGARVEIEYPELRDPSDHVRVAHWAVVRHSNGIRHGVRIPDNKLRSAGREYLLTR